MSFQSSEEDDRYTTMDEKKRKRMISNRESARRSRMKREQHMKDLNNQILFFNNKRDELIQKIETITKRYAAAETQNVILRDYKQELGKKLMKCEEIITCCGGEKKAPMGSQQDPWLRPWQQPPPQSTPIMSTTAPFQF